MKFILSNSLLMTLSSFPLLQMRQVMIWDVSEFHEEAQALSNPQFRRWRSLIRRVAQQPPSHVVADLLCANGGYCLVHGYRITGFVVDSIFALINVFRSPTSNSQKFMTSGLDPANNLSWFQNCHEH
jgi:hypothetical protein